jgi:hypothetical protein
VALPGKDPLVLRLAVEPADRGCEVLLETRRSRFVLALLLGFTGLLGSWLVATALLHRAPFALLGALPFVACGIAMLRLPARFRRERQEEVAFLRAWLGAAPEEGGSTNGREVGGLEAAPRGGGSAGHFSDDSATPLG